jgi:hypothetical protein
MRPPQRHMVGDPSASPTLFIGHCPPWFWLYQQLAAILCLISNRIAWRTDLPALPGIGIALTIEEAFEQNRRRIGAGG